MFADRPSVQVDIFNPSESGILDEIRALNLDELKPIEALTRLHEKRSPRSLRLASRFARQRPSTASSALEARGSGLVGPAARALRLGFQPLAYARGTVTVTVTAPTSCRAVRSTETARDPQQRQSCRAARVRKRSYAGTNDPHSALRPSHP